MSLVNDGTGNMVMPVGPMGSYGANGMGWGADQGEQTARIIQGINPAAVPAYIVQNPNCCQNFGYGSGCGC